MIDCCFSDFYIYFYIYYIYNKLLYAKSLVRYGIFEDFRHVKPVLSGFSRYGIPVPVSVIRVF